LLESRPGRCYGVNIRKEDDCRFIPCKTRSTRYHAELLY
jgi:hypothetical protein